MWKTFDRNLSLLRCVKHNAARETLQISPRTRDTVLFYASFCTKPNGVTLTLWASEHSSTWTSCSASVVFSDTSHKLSQAKPAAANTNKTKSLVNFQAKRKRKSGVQITTWEAQRSCTWREQISILPASLCLHTFQWTFTLDQMSMCVTVVFTWCPNHRYIMLEENWSDSLMKYYTASIISVAMITVNHSNDPINLPQPALPVLLGEWSELYTLKQVGWSG